MANFNDIERANATIKTTNIKGKDYAEVNQRIKAFRMLFPEGFIRSEIIDSDLDAGIVLMQAEVGYYDENGIERILGTGTAFEWKNDSKSMVNKTSYIENCETSAVGRALGMLALGIDVAIASAEEVKYAVAHQQEEEPAPTKKSPAKRTAAKKAPVPDQIICQRCGSPIQPFGNNTPQQVANATMKSFGKVMCMDCGNATKAEQIAQELAQNMVQDEELQLPFPIE